jgi:beta-lactamase superfamily II metal-dependent hydrolase
MEHGTKERSMSEQAALSRRGFLGGVGAAMFAVGAGRELSGEELTSVPATSFDTAASGLSQMEPWSPGLLDIHHISTGRGSSAFCILPDGTTLLIDAGDVSREPHLEEYLVAAKPSADLRPGQWIARYIQRHLTPTGNSGIDYFLLTHLHNDHMGSSTPQKPMSQLGPFHLSGVSDVAEVLPIHNLLDRAYPSYNYPLPLQDVHQQNYRSFVSSAVRRGTVAQRFKPGRADQIRLLKDRSRFPEFTVRNLAANGEVWTGYADATEFLFPPMTSLQPNQFPDENMCSVALRINYGAFSYYTGGDLTGDTNYGIDEWRNIETPVARASGPVTVAVANHHGFVNACGPDWVRALRPKAFIVNAWTSAHPTMTVLDQMFSPLLYPGPREVYSTAVRPESRVAVRRLDEMSSSSGHVVLRVSAGGRDLTVFCTSNEGESDRILSVHGPYLCEASL